MNLVQKIFLILTLVLTGLIVIYIGIENLTISNFTSLVLTPVALLFLCYLVVSHYMKGISIGGEKQPQVPVKKLKPMSPMEIYEKEKIKREQEELAMDALKANQGIKPKKPDFN